MKLKLSALSLTWISLVSCSSLSIYREIDCDISSEKYGQCFADVGYRPEGFQALSKYCANKGKPLDNKAFQETREKTLTEKCTKPSEVFTLAFRTAASLNGPETCAEELLTTPALKKASIDGRKAGISFKGSREFGSRIESSEERREKADDAGFLQGLEDRLLKENPEDLRQAQAKNEEKSKALWELYPEAKTPLLTQRRMCTSGNF